MAQTEQGDMISDQVIEDLELAEYLETVFNNEEAAARYRAGKKALKELMGAKYSQYINGDDDGVHTGFVRCGNYRFRPRASVREAGERPPSQITEGLNWADLKVEQVGRMI